MSGAKYEITTDDLAAMTALNGIVRQIEDTAGFYKAVAQLLGDATRERFRRETGPDGQPWQKLKRATIRRRETMGQTPITILRSNSKGKSGSSLAGSINTASDADSASIGTPKEYAAIHQFGGTIQIPARKGKIYRHKDPTTGMVGRTFVSKKDANDVTEIDIPAYSITMPARAFLGVSAEDQSDILDAAEAWLQQE